MSQGFRGHFIIIVFQQKSVLLQIDCFQDPQNNELEKTEWTENQKVNPQSFEDIKDALKKTLHVMIDLDFDDGKLDGVIRSFLDAKKFQIRLSLNLNPNDVILVRNLTRSKVTGEVLENIRKVRNRMN